MSDADSIETQTVDAMLAALRAIPGVRGVQECEPPSALDTANLPYIWLDVGDVPPPLGDAGVGYIGGHAWYELTVTAYGAYKAAAVDVKRVGREFIAQQQFAIMHAFVASVPDVREAGHSYGQSITAGVGGTQATWIVKYKRLRNDPFRGVDR